MLSNVSFAAS